MCFMQIKPSKNKNIISGNSGITLVELLLAVAILGIITTVVAMTFSVGIESWRAGTALSDSSNRASFILDQIVTALRSSYYPEASASLEEYGFIYEKGGGDSPNSEDKISWVKIGNSLVGEDAIWAGSAHRVELFLEKGTLYGPPGLYIKAWQLIGQPEDFDPEKDIDPILLSDQVVSFSCRMQDHSKALSPGDSFSWMDSWDDADKLPYHVLISIAVKPQKEREPPMEFTRCVHIPMAEMSWNPIDTTKENNSRSRSRRVPRSANTGERPATRSTTGVGGRNERR